MNGNCQTCDVEKLCAYPYKPCDCRDYLKFVPIHEPQKKAVVIEFKRRQQQ